MRWVKAIELLERHRGKIYCVRYENFVGHPEREINLVGNWLGVNFSPDAKKILKDTSVGKHKSGLTKEELKTVMRIAGPTMARLGYVLL